MTVFLFVPQIVPVSWVCVLWRCVFTHMCGREEAQARLLRCLVNATHVTTIKTDHEGAHQTNGDCLKQQACAPGMAPCLKMLPLWNAIMTTHFPNILCVILPLCYPSESLLFSHSAAVSQKTWPWCWLFKHESFAFGEARSRGLEPQAPSAMVSH